jgi:hypothetical protein
VCNEAGLTLAGKVGSRMIFDEVTCHGVTLGRFSGMLSWYREGRINGGQVSGRRWTELDRVTEVTWRTLPTGDGRLDVTGRLDANGTTVEIAYAITISPDRPEWTVEIVSARNIGQKAIDVRFFYLRPWTAAPDDPANRRKPQFAARNWDVWHFSDKGLVWKVFSQAPLLCEMNLIKDHPDVAFEPGEGMFPLTAGARYTPQGTMWACFRVERKGLSRP